MLCIRYATKLHRVREGGVRFFGLTISCDKKYHVEVIDTPQLLVYVGNHLTTIMGKRERYFKPIPFGEHPSSKIREMSSAVKSLNDTECNRHHSRSNSNSEHAVLTARESRGIGRREDVSSASKGRKARKPRSMYLQELFL